MAWAPPRNVNQGQNMPQTSDSEYTHLFKNAQISAIATQEIPKILVIMANFSDYALVSSKAVVDSMFNAADWTTDGAKGSVRQYFYDQSSGQYNPQFDVVGPITLSQTYSYYGANSGSKKDANVGYMITEACALVDDSVNFANYDMNGDGKVDLVFVLYAGFGENDPPTTDLVPVSSKLIWPHYWNIESAGYGTNNRTFDGVDVFAYECSCELDGYYSTAAMKVVAGIGIACHEFGHALGLPDWYSTNGYSHKTLGRWSIMDYGCYNDDLHSPAAYTLYERQLLGWQQPDTIIEDGTNYYLIEQRTLTGWDRGLPGAGWMLTYIRPNLNSNNNAQNMAYDIIEADGQAPTYSGGQNIGWFGKAGDLFNTRNQALYNLGCDTTLVPDTTTIPDTIPTAIVATQFPAQRKQTQTIMQNGQIYIITDWGKYTIVGIKQY